MKKRSGSRLGTPDLNFELNQVTENSADYKQSRKVKRSFKHVKQLQTVSSEPSFVNLAFSAFNALN